MTDNQRAEAARLREALVGDYTGDVMPFDELKPEIQARWQRVADAARVRVPMDIEAMADAGFAAWYGDDGAELPEQSAPVRARWAGAIRAALAAGGLEPCAVPEYDPNEVALAPTGTVLRNRLVKAEAKIERQRAELEKLNHLRQLEAGERAALRDERDGLQKRNDVQTDQLRRLDREISPLMTEIASLRERASVPVPAGVPSVHELTLLGRNAYQEKLGFAKFDSYKEMSVEAQMGDGAMATAIRDAVLAGVAGELEQAKKLASGRWKALKELSDKMNTMEADARHVVSEAKRYAPDYPYMRHDILEAIWAVGQSLEGTRLACDDLQDPPSDQVEALARVLHEAEPSMPPATYKERNEALARAAIAHLSKRPEGPPSREQIAKIVFDAWAAAYPDSDATKYTKYERLVEFELRGHLAVADAILTALRPWLRDPVGWELVLDYGAIATIIHSAKNMAISDEWVSTASIRVLDLCRKRIKPVYKCKECAKKDDTLSRLREWNAKLNTAVVNVRAALEGE